MERDNNSSLGSVKSLIRSISDRYRDLLSKDITAGSRKKRRERECARRGISTSEPKAGEGVNETKVVSGLLTKGEQAKFSVGGEDFTIDEKTWVFGELVPGSQAIVTVELLPEGILKARKIVVKA